MTISPEMVNKAFEYGRRTVVGMTVGGGSLNPMN